MRLTKVTLHNFRSYSDLEVEITPGLIGIKGPNGSGKSNFLESIFFGLTGGSLTDSNKDAMLKWGETRGYVILEWDNNGTPLTIERWLGRERVTLTQGEEKIIGARLVNASLSSLFPIPVEYLKDVLFVAQEKLDEPLTGPESARKDGFGKLFGCSKFDKLRDILQEAVSRYSLKAKPPSPQQLEALKDALLALDKSIKDYSTVEKDLEKGLSGVDIQELYRTVNSPKMSELIRRRETRQTQKEMLEKVLEEYAPEEVKGFDRLGLTLLEKSCKDAQYMATKGVCPTCGHVTEPPSEKDIEETRETLKFVEDMKRRIARFDKAANDLVTVGNELMSLPDPSTGVTDEEAEGARAKLAEARDFEVKLRQVLADRKFAEGRRAGVAQAIEDHLEQEKQALRLSEGLNTLSSVRDAMHREALQKRVRAYGAKKINEHLEVFASVFNIPYKEFFTEEGLMQFIDPKTSTEHGFSELSGGQRKLVALTYRLALMRLFAQGLNLAVLDEPTAYIDEENVDAMRDAFVALDGFARKRGMTVFVATHEPALLPVFPRVLERGNV